MISAASSAAGRHFVALSSVFSVRPIFEHELNTHKCTGVLASASGPPERVVLKRNYEMLLSAGALAGYARSLRWFFRLCAHVFLIKAAFYLYTMHFQFRIFHKQDRLTVDKHEGTTPTYSYGCVQSNCSALFDPDQGRAGAAEARLDWLPIFTICYPRLASYYEPVQHEFGLGTAFFVCVVLYVLELELSVFTLAPKLTSDNAFMIFLVAPDLASRQLLNRALAHLGELRYSYRNYLEFEQLRRYKEMAHYGGCSGGGDTSARLPVRKGTSEAATDKLAAPASELEMARDCLPLIRSSWWHKIIEETTARLTSVLLASVALATVPFCLVGVYFGARMAEAAREFDAEVSRANCSLWRRDEPARTGSAPANTSRLDLASLDFGMSAFCVLMAAILIGCWTTLWACTALTNMYLYVWELRCWICELRFKLTIVQPLSEDLLDWHLTRRSEHLLFAFDYDKVRLVFMREVSTSWFQVRHKSFRDFSKRLEVERMLEENFFHTPTGGAGQMGNPEGAMAELLTKLYVELRLMNELRDDVERRIALMTVVAIVTNYMTSLTSIYITRVLEEPRPELLLLLVGGNMLPIMMIMNTVSISTQSRKLSPLLGSILARLSLASTSQLRHMRSLWQRLTIEFDPTVTVKGGPLRVRFTYVSMIQIVFWVATMFLFVLRV